jgi:hypothetical protein
MEYDDDTTALSIIRSGMDVNGEWNGFTHLYWASYHNRVAVVACLLELGADADKTTPSESTPLGLAAYYGRQELVELLVEVGKAQMDIHFGDVGLTALHSAAIGGKLETAKYLVARGCNIDVQTYGGETAIETGDPHIARFLTSVADHVVNGGGERYRSLLDLCAPFCFRLYSHRLSLCLRTTFMLCLLSTKAAQVDDIIVPSGYAGITLMSRIYDHEKGLVRHILSFVGTNQDAAPNESELLQRALLRIAALEQTIAAQQRTIISLQQAVLRQAGSSAPASSAPASSGSPKKRARQN